MSLSLSKVREVLISPNWYEYQVLEEHTLGVGGVFRNWNIEVENSSPFSGASCSEDHFPLQRKDLLHFHVRCEAGIPVHYLTGSLEVRSTIVSMLDLDLVSNPYSPRNPGPSNT